MSVATRQLFDLPPEMARLPRDHRGYPVPEFVAWIDGVPDFRIIKPGWFVECHNNRRCWLCGGGMGSRMWFVTGPMCTVTRTNSELPNHRGCATFAVRNCPFLTKPLAKRNERDMPEDGTMGGVGIMRNPGVAAIWETKSYKIFRDERGIPLIQMGDPTHVSFWREGRKATSEEVRESIRTGLPALEEVAAKQQGGTQALRETLLDYQETVFKRWA